MVSSLLKKGDRHLERAANHADFGNWPEPVPIFQQAVRATLVQDGRRFFSGNLTVNRVPWPG